MLLLPLPASLLLLLLPLLPCPTSAANPAADLLQCLQAGTPLGDCLTQTVEALGGKYKAGVPELGLPSLDPLIMPKIELQLGNSVVKFEDIWAKGLSDYNVTYVNYDKSKKSINLGMAFKEMESTGKYTVTILGKSSGPYHKIYRNIVVDGVAKVVKKGNKVEVDTLDLKIDVGQIKVQLECLFPKESLCPDPETHSPSSYSSDCCCAKNKDRGELQSCNPLLAKTTHKAINKSGRGSLVQRFQPQISASVGGLVKNYLNGAFGQLDADVFF